MLIYEQAFMTQTDKREKADSCTASNHNAGIRAKEIRICVYILYKQQYKLAVYRFVFAIILTPSLFILFYFFFFIYLFIYFFFFFFVLFGPLEGCFVVTLAFSGT